MKALNLVDGEFSKPTFQAYASNKDFRELPLVFPLAKVDETHQYLKPPDELE